MNSEKKRNHVIMIFDSSFMLLRTLISIIATMFFYSIFNFAQIAEDENFIEYLTSGDAMIFIAIFIVLLVFAFVISITLLVNYFIYRKSYYQVNEDNILIQRRTIFGYMKKELYFSKIATINVKKRVHHRVLKVCEITFNTSSSKTATKNDLKLYMTVTEADQIKELHKLYNESIKNKTNTEVVNEAPVSSETDQVVSYESTVGLNIDREEEQLLSFGVFTAIKHYVFLFLGQVIFLLAMFAGSITEILYSNSFFILAFTVLSGAVYIVFNSVKTVTKLSNFKLFQTTDGFRINHGLLTTLEKNVVLKNIKKIEMKRIRLFNQSYLTVDAVGIDMSNQSEREANNFVQDDNVLSLFTKHDTTKKVLHTIIPELTDLKPINYKYNIVYMQIIISFIIFIAIFVTIYLVSMSQGFDLLGDFATIDLNGIEVNTFIVFIVLYLIVLIIASVIRIVRWAYFTKYDYNEQFLVCRRGLIFEKTQIIRKKDIQVTEVKRSFLKRLFNISDIIFYVFKTSALPSVVQMDYLQQDQLTNIIDDIKPKV